MRLVIFLAAAAMLAAPAAARELTVAVEQVPEALAGAVRTTLLTPFTDSTGHPASLQIFPGGLAAISQQAGRPAAGGVTAWDVIDIHEADLQPACEQGLVEKLDWAAIGGRDRVLPQGASDCGLGTFMHSTVLTWDRDKFPVVPTWSDFWDVAKYPGKRGLFHGARGNLEIALLADGVSPDNVYATLRSREGVDRAFRKLDQLKPYVVWWSTPDQPIKYLGAGDVLMSSAPNDTVTAADRGGRHGFAIQWAGSLYCVDSWAIVKGAPDRADAESFLRFAGDPARQAALLPLLAYGGLARGANDRLPAELMASSPSAPANMANALHVDPAFWRDNLATIEARFAVWVAH